METQLEYMIKQRQLSLWAEITKHYPVSDKLREKIPRWIHTGRLSDKAISYKKAQESAVQHDNRPSSVHR